MQTLRSAAVSLTALLSACVSTSPAPPPDVPASIRVPDRLALAHETPATGVQIYDCAPSKSDPSTFEWTFRAPEAQLFDKSGRTAGKHYAGPTWEANDGSKVVAEVKGRDNGPDKTAIPWLLLVTKSASGSGTFGRTQAIQRVNTVGGLAPASGCTAAEKGKEARVPYKAIYYFYVPAQ
jgi:FtsP/CotA-like multicopper oxidase with cupredoxin domain